MEFAVLLIPLLIIAMGLTEFGRAMFYYNTLVKSTRDATRLMTSQIPTNPTYATLKTSAACFAVYGNSACTGNSIVPGLTTAMVYVCDRSSTVSATCPDDYSNVPTGTGAINLVTVRIIGYPYPLLVAAPFLGIPSTLSFATISTTMRQS